MQEKQPTYGTIVNYASAQTYFNPFPGLRPFGMEESHLFFGREGQSEEVLEKLIKNKFVAVIGSSGSGKSSLMYCGIAPVLHGDFQVESRSKWRIVVIRPGSSPINNLALSIVNSDMKYKGIDEDTYFKQRITESVLRSSSLGLVEAFKQLLPSPDENFMVMVDQFEELFRYKRADADTLDIAIAKYNESLAFIKLLLEAVYQKEIPIYVVLTMRSDFIGECAQYQELTTLINESHYLIPQMTREDLENAIIGPVAVGNGYISERLLHQLLNDVGDKPDQLPLLQHALMRTWDYWITHKQEDEPMDIIHYEAIGKIQKALLKHANEAYDELDEKGKVLCERIFKSITEKGPDGREIRRPLTVSELAKIAHAQESEIINVTDKFRIKGRSFLNPSYESELSEISLIDISHESLMRIWDRLSNWVDEEAQSARMYLRLSDAAKSNQTGKSGLWRPPDLELALNWKRQQQPTPEWANRYDKSYTRAINFLANSEKTYLAEEQNKVRQQRRAVQRTRMFALILGIATIISLALMLYAFIAQVESKRNEGKAKIERIKAYRQKLMADINAEIAETQSRRAIRNEHFANIERFKALIQTLRADLNAKIAQKESKNAIFQKNLADQKKGEAERNAQLASEQRQLAYTASQRADTLRMLSISQSMAVKSLLINRDTTLRSLVSYMSYLFNNDFKGLKNNPDIYNSLYFANKLLNTFPENDHFVSHTSPVRSIIYHSQNNTFYSSGSDRKIIKWDLDNPVMKDTMVNSVADVGRCMAISPDGKYLACGSQNSFIQVYDLQSDDNNPVAVYNQHVGPIVSIRFTRNNYLVSAGADQTIRITDFRNPEVSSKILYKAIKKITALTISYDSKYFACGLEDGLVLLWNINSLIKSGIFKNTKKIFTLDIFNSYQIDTTQIVALEFNHKSNVIASGDLKGVVNVIDFLSHDKDYVQLTGQTARINELKFSPDDKLLAAASFDGSILVWDSKNLNNQPLVLKDNKTWVWTIAFTNKSEEILAGYKDGTIQKWPLKLDYLADLLFPRIKRNMSIKEWDRYVAEDIIPIKVCDKPFDKDVLARIEELKTKK